MQQCPTCYSDTLTTGEDSATLVCETCGEQFTGFRREETDALLSGTAISNRQSQSQQAHSTRQRLSLSTRKTCSPNPNPATSPSSIHQARPIEPVAHIAHAIVTVLSRHGYDVNHLKKTLFHIIVHWMDHLRQHPSIRLTVRQLIAHAFALVSLACLHTCLPILPRDLRCILSAQSMRGLKGKDEDGKDSYAVLAGCPPTTQEMIIVANWHARSGFVWPPMDEFFESEDRTDMVGWDRRKSFRAFPLGNLGVTLWRVCRMVGVPDKFGGRVLRYLQLENEGYAYLKMREGGRREEGKVVTDEGLQIAFMNTLRLCYETRGKGTCTREEDLEREWEGCKRRMKVWMKYGHFEDMSAVSWSGLSPYSLAGGGELQREASIVDAMLGEMANSSELGNNFVQVFAQLGSGGEVVDEGIASCDYAKWFETIDPQVKSLVDCAKLPSQKQSTSSESSESSLNDVAREDDMQDNDMVTYMDEVEKNKRSDITEDARIEQDEQVVVSDSACISLVWTALRRFFAGSSCYASGGDACMSDLVVQQRLSKKCAKSLDVVLAFLRYLKRDESDSDVN